MKYINEKRLSQLHWNINCDREEHCDADVAKENPNFIRNQIREPK